MSASEKTQFLDLETIGEKIDWLLQIDPKTLERERELGTAGKLAQFSKTFSEFQKNIKNLDAAKIENTNINLANDLSFPLELMNINLQHPKIPLIEESLINPDWSVKVAVVNWLNAVNYILHSDNNVPAEAAKAPKYEGAICRALSIINNLFVMLISKASHWVTKSGDTKEIPESFFIELIETVAEPTKKNASEIAALLEQLKRDTKASEKQLEQIKAIASEASDEAAQKGIAKEARHFSLESKGHTASAQKWLVAAIVGAVLIVGLSFYFYCCDQPTATETLKMIDWNNFIPKFSALAIFIFLEFVVVSNYRAERHNAIVNRHRSNALATFETMTQSTSTTQDVRDAVTITAANAIYAPQETGFGKKTAFNQMNAADILGNLASRNSD